MSTTQWNLKLGKKGDVDWSNPEFLVVVMLVILLGLALFFFIFKLRGKLTP